MPLKFMRTHGCKLNLFNDRLFIFFEFRLCYNQIFRIEYWLYDITYAKKKLKFKMECWASKFIQSLPNNYYYEEKKECNWKKQDLFSEYPTLLMLLQPSNAVDFLTIQLIITIKIYCDLQKSESSRCISWADQQKPTHITKLFS